MYDSIMKKSDRKLLMVLGCVLAIAFYMHWNSQPMNLGRIERHISEIRPLWEEFQRKNSGFENVRFYPFTGGNGMFSAVGEVATVEQRSKLKEFMESTNPPRPVFIRSLRVVELVEMIEAAEESSGVDP